jgi:UPF0716 family protein affecting phage T7 exclusion
MRAVVATLTVMWLIAAAVGTVITGLFWLTLVSFAGVLMAGATGVSMILRRAEEVASPAESEAVLRVLPTAGRFAHSEPSEEAGQLGRAA